MCLVGLVLEWFSLRCACDPCRLVVLYATLNPMHTLAGSDEPVSVSIAGIHHLRPCNSECPNCQLRVNILCNVLPLSPHECPKDIALPQLRASQTL